VQFRDPIALEDWRKVGAKVVGEMVYLDRGLVRDLIATIPADFTYSRATPPTTSASAGASGLRADDRRALPARSRRRAPQPDARRSGDVPQAQPHAPAMHSSRIISWSRWTIPISHRHLRITYSSMKHSDKTFMGMTTSPKNAEDVMEMCAILFGEEFMEERTPSPPATATATRRWSGTRRCWARCAPSAAAQPAGAVLALRARRRQHARLVARPWRS
jgi:trimethylamine--corrinoid protein Co-methyltransferase